MKTDELLKLLSTQWRPPSCAFIPEFRCATGYARESRADAIAMNLWPSAKDGLKLYGFELKVSRGDWLREMKQTYKAEPIKQFCDYWYVVCADVTIVKYADEMPKGWDLMFAENGKLITMIEAPKLEPLPLDRAFVAALMRRATRVDGLSHLVPTNNDWSKKTVA
jgi:hypothetical protein